MPRIASLPTFEPNNQGRVPEKATRIKQRQRQKTTALKWMWSQVDNLSCKVVAQKLKHAQAFSKTVVHFRCMHKIRYRRLLSCPGQEFAHLGIAGTCVVSATGLWAHTTLHFSGLTTLLRVLLPKCGDGHSKSGEFHDCSDCEVSLCVTHPSPAPATARVGVHRLYLAHFHICSVLNPCLQQQLRPVVRASPQLAVGMRIMSLSPSMAPQRHMLCTAAPISQGTGACLWKTFVQKVDALIASGSC